MRRLFQVLALSNARPLLAICRSVLWIARFPLAGLTSRLCVLLSCIGSCV